jgi:Helix-loop-helix DNA-binding domain
MRLSLTESTTNMENDFQLDDSSSETADPSGMEIRRSETMTMSVVTSGSTPSSDFSRKRRAKKRLDGPKREERNAREKERSTRIAQQIHDLSTVLSDGGVEVPKGTKSTILVEATKYIRLMQERLYRLQR